MLFLADENVPRSVVDALRDGGDDVRWIREDAPGISDRAVLARAVEDGRVLITFDKDFGELARHDGLSAQAGVILIRVSLPPGRDQGRLLARVLAARRDWPGHFAVIEAGRIRMRPLRLQTGQHRG